MFWNKNKNDNQPTNEVVSSDSSNLVSETSQIQSIVTELTDESKENNSLREKASERAESLELNKFPKEMSCMTALDELMQCMSLGGQIRNYYRYGDFTLCDKQSEKLNFCFSNSLNMQDVKEVNVQEFYKKRLVEQLKRGSSEDVWQSRD
ncbi:hypothetical protein CANINC_002338 [Pichia inconspicua]|uniref:Early meiotic induction protein 1 n=1 Tax=Pichia inconspicua TaxID=52247 RepID=A0A4T0X1C8_9ASCO|nr:hypothetical protein CANINC_002338 [[Candida] inconspicua]